MSAQQPDIESHFSGALPDWVPAGAQHYLAHTEDGTSIRSLARAAGCHASTVLRQIRKIELQRDDPLVDAALRHLSDARKSRSSDTSPSGKEITVMTAPAVPDEETLYRDSIRILRRLREAGAVLAVAAEMEKAVVVRETPDGGSTRTAVVDAAVAEAMALKNWITPSTSGRIIRYHITHAGRLALEEALGRPDGACAPETDGKPDTQKTNLRSRHVMGENPLMTLARLRDKSGKRFLGAPLVHAGEQLREDFELAQMDTRVTQNWDHFLAPNASAYPASATPEAGPAAARARVESALTHLGPGLSDVALRCRCYLEGLETVEKQLGWSARSAKIVLRIALVRLRRHYDETLGPAGPLIG